MSSGKTEDVLRHRPAPQQARARATVAKIQEAAKIILVEQGPHGLNTNLIAERAGVNVATVYNYYPDKFAVLVHLFSDFEDERASYVREQLDKLGPDSNLSEWTSTIIDRLASMRTDGGYQIALRRALVSVPELARLDHE
ncbi:MAG: TetR/AcrR family transcriptional regulator, partial [Aeromicrobium sp.]